MNIHLVTSCIIFMGIALMVYLTIRLGASYRVVVRQMEELETQDNAPGEQAQQEQSANPLPGAAPSAGIARHRRSTLR